MSKMIALLSMIATLAIAYGLDRWTWLLQKRASADFNYVCYFWISAAANLLIAGLWLFLAWWMFSHISRGWWVGVIFLVLGLLLIFFLPIQFSAPENLLNSALFAPTRSIRAALMTSGFTSRFSLSTAYIALIGAASLLPRKERQEMRKSGEKEIWQSGNLKAS